MPPQRRFLLARNGVPETNRIVATPQITTPTGDSATIGTKRYTIDTHLTFCKGTKRYTIDKPRMLPQRRFLLARYSIP